MSDHTNQTSNPFRRLFQIDVSNYIEKKGQFNYLSWPFAVAQLRLADPDASWEVKRFDGLPYLVTDLGVFVEVAVTVAGVTLSQIHPCLDAKNRPIMAPTSFDINTSIQRAVVKAIALHGLGLSIVRRIVEKMGGQVGVQSGEPGTVGCRFYFTLSQVD